MRGGKVRRVDLAIVLRFDGVPERRSGIGRVGLLVEELDAEDEAPRAERADHERGDGHDEREHHPIGMVAHDGAVADKILAHRAQAEQPRIAALARLALLGLLGQGQLKHLVLELLEPLGCVAQLFGGCSMALPLSQHPASGALAHLTLLLHPRNVAIRPRSSRAQRRYYTDV